MGPQLVRGTEARQEISASIVAGGPDVAYAAKVHYDLDLQHETGQSHFIHQPFFEASSRPMLRRLAAGVDLKRAARVDDFPESCGPWPPLSRSEPASGASSSCMGR